MIKIGNIFEAFDVKNAPTIGARLVIQPDFRNNAFRTVPTFEKDFPSQAEALNFAFDAIGKSFFRTYDNAGLAAVITGGTFYVDIITHNATRKSFRVDTYQERFEL